MTTANHIHALMLYKLELQRMAGDEFAKLMIRLNVRMK